MHKNLNMEYNLIKITDNRFLNISNTILSNKKDLVNIINGNIEDDNIEEISYLPKKYNITDLTDTSTPSPILTVVQNFIDTEETSDLFCNLAAYYGKGGFIGWHTNSNYNLYNAICTFSDNGDSYFQYIKDGKIITINDNEGWYVKKSYWSNNIKVPHRAVSNCNRITITFSSNNENIIDDFIKKIIA